MDFAEILFIDDSIEVIIGDKMYSFKVRDICKDKLIVSNTFNCTIEKLGVKEKKIVYVKTYKTNGIYEFDMIVVAITQEKTTCILELELCSEIKKRQRREFFRLDVTIPVQIKVIHDNEKGKKSEYEAVTLDISGGGMKAKTKDALPAEANVEIMIYFSKYYNELEDVYIMGRILRWQKTMNDDSEYIVFIQFNRLERDESEKIVRYIFEIQREELRRKKNK